MTVGRRKRDVIEDILQRKMIVEVNLGKVKSWGGGEEGR